MKITDIPFGTTDWNTIPCTEHAGITGMAYWRNQNFGDIRVRMVEYTPGYLADHWCEKGHILLCLEGRLETELADGRKFVLAGNQLSGRGSCRSAPLIDRNRRETVHRRLDSPSKRD